MSLSFSRAARMSAAISIPLMFAAAMPMADGMTYDFVMKSQSTRTGNKETVTMSGKGTFAGDQAKIEITDAGAAGANGQSMFGGKGSYFIVKGGGKEMFMVDPSQKQYMAWDINSMLGGMSKMMGAMGGMVKMQMSDVHIDAQDMGAGEVVQGYPTRHIRMVQNYTMTTSVFGRASKSTNATTTDYYFSPKLNIANPFMSNNQAGAAMSDMFNNPDFKTQMQAAQAKMPHGGVPLKTITTAITTDSKGKQETSVSTMEMMNLHAGNVPASAFAIPHDYTLVQMPTMNMSAGGNGGDNVKKEADAGPVLNVDSVAAAAKAGAADATKQEVKNAAKDAAGKKLRGIFKH